MQRSNFVTEQWLLFYYIYILTYNIAPNSLESKILFKKELYAFIFKIYDV